MHPLLKNKPQIALMLAPETLPVESHTYSATFWTLSEVYSIMF